MLSKAEARQIVTELVHKYGSEKNTFEDPDYNEARTRQDFINPFFKLLGWDMDNEKRLSQSFREVLYEDKVSIDGNIKHPDYSFRIGNSVLFYVEAKKPSVNIKDNKEAALQLRYYGWNTGLTLSILTNFREFAVYDCRVKPDRKDQAHVARLTYFTYKDLLESQTKFSGGFQDGFDFLANVFVQENILRGSFDKFIQDDGDRFKKGVVAIDQSFLQTLEDWRLILVKSLCKTNKEISEHDLNYIVSAVLNRIVFLRFAEGREIEPFGNVRKTIQTSAYGECYKELFTLFERADEKYNSGLFDLGKDNAREQLFVDNSILKKIIGNLYYPSPYAFDIIPVEILGSVYERFLGSVVRLTPGHHVKVEPKPEVRKAGGVFYTPQYIVDYIVEHTIGELVKDKTPAEVAKIKVVDPSCGSGSFLLGAYQYLLDWHKNYYTAKYEKEGKTPKGLKNDTLTPFGELATTVKKLILVNNIFGVDIDENAVEITKLSLLLKCLEGETTASIENTQRLFHEKVLPNIDGNIRCGNSLVDTEYYDEFYDDAAKLVKPFHWRRAFPQVFKQGGFDAVIGNPPWGADLRADKKYFKTHFENTSSDSAAYFLEQAQKLSKSKVGMIVPKTISFYSAWQSIRHLILENCRLIKIADVGIAFSQVNLESVILIFDKKDETDAKRKHLHPKIYRGIPWKLPHAVKEIVELGEFDTRITSITQSFPMIGLREEEANLIWKLYKNSTKLGDIADNVFRGLYISDAEKESLRKGKTQWINKVPDVKRWMLTKVNMIALPAEYKAKSQKIMVPRVFFKVLRGNRLVAFPDIKGELLTTEKLVNVTLLQEKYPVSYLFLCAVLNSPITSWYLQKVLFSDTTETARVMDRIYSQYIILPLIDLSQKEHKQIHEKIDDCASQLLSLYTEKETIHVLSNQYTLEDKIAHFERKIDELVYRLYGLTAEEIAIVEEAYKTH